MGTRTWLRKNNKCECAHARACVCVYNTMLGFISWLDWRYSLPLLFLTLFPLFDWTVPTLSLLARFLLRLLTSCLHLFVLFPVSETSCWFYRFPILQCLQSLFSLYQITAILHITLPFVWKGPFSYGIHLLTKYKHGYCIK